MLRTSLSRSLAGLSSATQSPYGLIIVSSACCFDEAKNNATRRSTAKRIIARVLANGRRLLLRPWKLRLRPRREQQRDEKHADQKLSKI